MERFGDLKGLNNKFLESRAGNLGTGTISLPKIMWNVTLTSEGATFQDR